MSGRFLLLALASVATGFGQYVYDSTDGWSGYAPIGSRWAQNGSPTLTYNGPPSYSPYVNLAFPGTGGSLIDVVPLSGSNPNDYEVQSTLGLKAGGGTYIQFLRAGSNAVQAGTGSYVSAEIVMPPAFTGTGTATLNVNQSVNGVLTQLASTSITATDGMTFRTVIFGSNLWIFVNNVRVVTQTVSASSGNPGIGGYGQPSGSGFLTTSLGHHDTAAPGQVVARTFASSLFPTSASLRWQGVLDDGAGIGVFEYLIARN